MTGGVLVVGEALIDTIVEEGRVAHHPGGSPANVAIGLARLEVATRLHTAIGADEGGEIIRRHLDDSGVVLTPESITHAPTSRAVATVGGDGGATYEFDVTWQPTALVELGAPRVVHTGSLGAILSPGYRVTADILDRARALGAIISFDPNVRPSLMIDEREFRERLIGLATSSNLTKLSDEDADVLFPGAGIDDVLDDLLAAGVGVAAVTRGSEGARLASGTHRVDVPSITTSVADTVGAGDSFMAALIHALVFDGSGWDAAPVPADRLAAVGHAAARAAGITVSRRGANPPTLRELRAL